MAEPRADWAAAGQFGGLIAVRAANFVLSSGYLFLLAILIYVFYEDRYPTASTVFFYAALLRAVAIEPLRANLINIVVAETRAARLMVAVLRALTRAALVGLAVFAAAAGFGDTALIATAVPAYTLVLFANEVQDTFARLYAPTWASIRRRVWRYVRALVGIPLIASAGAPFPLLMVATGLILLDMPWRDGVRLLRSKPLFLAGAARAELLRRLLRTAALQFVVSTYVVMGSVTVLRAAVLAVAGHAPGAYFAFDMAFRFASITINALIVLASEKRIRDWPLRRFLLVFGTGGSAVLGAGVATYGLLALTGRDLGLKGSDWSLAALCFLAIFGLFAASTRFVLSR